jgi:hypothetical protein
LTVCAGSTIMILQKFMVWSTMNCRQTERLRPSYQR